MGSHRVLLSAGSNARGQLGIGSYDDAHTFTPCRFRSTGRKHESNDQHSSSSDWRLPDHSARVAQIACGANHTVLLLENDDGSMTLWGAGDGRRGQLGIGFEGDGDGDGDGDGHTAVEAEEETGEGTRARTRTGTRAGVRAADPELPAPEREPPLAASKESVVFRRLVFGMLVPQASGGRGGTQSAYAPRIVAAAWETTYVVFTKASDRSGSSTLDSDVLVSMGSNDFGALGVDTGEPSDAVVQRTRKMGRHDGPLATTGAPRVVALDHVFPPDKTPGRARRVIRVRSLHAGPRHVIAELVVTTHSGDASGSSPQSQTVLVGWGAARHGQLGRDLSGTRFVARPTLLPIDVHEDPMVSCALGNQHTVVLHASGRISALGSNKQGQIPSSLGSRRRTMCRLGCTWSGTYMQADDEDGPILLSMGNNAQGQLGRGHTVDSTSAIDTTVCLPPDRAISTFVCGSEHVLVAMSNSLREGDSVLGWGWNEHGNMGLGSLGNVTVPTKLWPREDIEAYHKYPQRVIGVWAGCATSWLLVE